MNTMLDRRKILEAIKSPKPRLPEDFQELEYLESSGTEFVDSGQRGVTGSEFEISFANPSGWVLGAVVSKNNPTDFGVYRTTIRYGTQYAENLDIPSKSVVKVDKYGYTINDVTTNWSSTANYIGNEDIQLFGAKKSSASFACIIYYYKHKINGVLVQHFIPCYQKSTDINGYYDLVNNVFHQEQGGKLIRGNEIHYLPKGFKQLRYLRSSGKQFIDTGFIPNINTKIEVDFQLTTTTQQQYSVLLGTQNNENGRPVVNVFCINEISARFSDDTNYSAIHTNEQLDLNKHKLKLEFNKLTYDGVEYLGNNTFTKKLLYPIYLYARDFRNAPFQNSFSLTKLFLVRMWNGNDLARLLVPCYQESTNIVGYYDLISKTFFTNQGTGNFGYETFDGIVVAPI